MYGSSQHPNENPPAHFQIYLQQATKHSISRPTFSVKKPRETWVTNGLFSVESCRVLEIGINEMITIT